MRKTQWKFYLSSEEAWEAMLSDVREARSSIRFMHYIFNDLKSGQIGREFADLFIQKAREGVRVQMLVDAFGGISLYFSGVARELRAAGVELHFHVASPYRGGNPLHSVARNHRKMMVVDESIAFFGGVIVEEKARYWRDTHLRFVGPIVKHVCTAFDLTWKEMRLHQSPSSLPKPLRADGFTLLEGGPGNGKGVLLRELLRAIRGAKEYIYVTTPFFIPPQEFFDALKDARARGADVQLLISGPQEGVSALLATRSYFKALLEAQINTYMYPKYLHAKTICVDDHWATVGSANTDLLSLQYNYELNVVSGERGFVHELAMQFLEDVRVSHVLRPAHQKAFPDIFGKRLCGEEKEV